MKLQKNVFQIIFILIGLIIVFPFRSLTSSLPLLRLMYWVNTVDIYMNNHWKYFTFWAVASLLGSTPGCWHQQGGEKKNQPGSHHFLFLPLSLVTQWLCSPSHFLVLFVTTSEFFWFCHQQIYGQPPKENLTFSKTVVWILKSTLLSGITRADKNSGLHPFVNRVEHISSLNPHFNFFTVSLRRLICVHFHFHKPTFTFCLFCQLKNISRESHSIFFVQLFFLGKWNRKGLTNRVQCRHLYISYSLKWNFAGRFVSNTRRIFFTQADWNIEQRNESWFSLKRPHMKT